MTSRPGVSAMLLVVLTILAAGCAVFASDDTPQAELERSMEQSLNEGEDDDRYEVECRGDLPEKPGSRVICDVFDYATDDTFTMTVTSTAGGYSWPLPPRR